MRIRMLATLVRSATRAARRVLKARFLSLGLLRSEEKTKGQMNSAVKKTLLEKKC
jgi:hypothetical protein